MGTNVKLYYTTRGENTEWELIPSKLFVVEDIASYLSSKTNKAISDFQYIKNELEISINVDLSQEYAQPLTTSNFKYVSIQNAGENIHYYFVKKAIWRSKTCVRFDLVMDVLNTFEENKDYKFKANTRIIREHKSRFIRTGEGRYISITFDDSDQETENLPSTNPISITDGENVFFSGEFVNYDYDGSRISGITLLIPPSDTRTDNQILANFRDLPGDYEYYITDDSGNILDISFDGEYAFAGENEPKISRGNKVYRNIDIVQENINPILQCDNAQGTKINYNKNLLNCDWYLLYRNQNNPTDSLVNPVECYLIPSKTGIKVDSGYIENGRLIPSFIEEGKYYWFGLPTGKTATLSSGITISGPAYCLVTKANNKLDVSSIINATSSGYEINGNYNNIDYITFSSLPIAYAKTNDFKPSNTGDLYYLSLDQSFDNSGTYTELDSIEKLDRTDSRNIKLIKLPYVPYDFSVNGTTLEIDEEDKWELVQLTQVGGGIIYILKLKDLNTPLKCSLSNSQISTFYYLYFGLYANINPSVNDLRQSINYESKLFHSEFYQPTFYYDSFAFKVQLEKCYLPFYYDYDEYAYVKIDFNMTKTINSKFMFTFKNYYLKNAEENYAKYLPIARNNEEVLYNVPYINYIRNGYQYDVKNKNIATISNSIGLGLSIASIGASLLAPTTTLKVAGVVGSLVSMAMSVKNTIVSAVQNENSIKQKMTQYQNQSSSVAGSDDVDLMSVYAENRLKYLVYKPTEIMSNLIFDLFFYAGYSSNRMGIPSHNNRVNFDYLECEASIEAIGSIPQECLDEIIGAMKNGITYLHKTSRLSDKWDFEQKYENWENDML